MTKSNLLYQKDEEIVINSKIINTPTPVEITKEEEVIFTPTPNVDNSELFEGIKKIFNENIKIERNNVYFGVYKNCKIKYSIDNTIFAPNSLAMLQPRRFEELYLKQLESYIFTSKEEIDTSKLFAIIYLFSRLNKKEYPIRLVTAKNVKLLILICKTLNIFFNKNYNVIYSIYTMFNSIKDSEEEQNGK